MFTVGAAVKPLPGYREEVRRFDGGEKTTGTPVTLTDTGPLVALVDADDS